MKISAVILWVIDVDFFPLQCPVYSDLFSLHSHLDSEFAFLHRLCQTE